MDDDAAWATLMARMRRKTLIVCGACHQDLARGRALAAWGMASLGWSDINFPHGSALFTCTASLPH
ncbi:MULTISPECIES: hypothetical protein [Streptomyces]|uniref:hypothetical protein n=1 Tax=Streptomyces TaxID=1883 RepID=UPI00359FDF51